MIAEKLSRAVPTLQLYATVTEALAQARTPLELLAVLAEEGCEQDLWMLALPPQAGGALDLVSRSPLAPAVAARCLRDFAGVTPSDPAMPRPAARTLCLAPELPVVKQGNWEYEEALLPLGDGQVAILRAGRVDEGGRHGGSRFGTLSLLAAPYLRGLLRARTPGVGAIIDAESGTYCWPCFLDALEREVERSRRTGTELAVVLLELRPLARGGVLSPELHALVGQHAVRCIRSTDMVGRMSPSAYAVFLHNTGPRQALIAAGRLEEALRSDPRVRAQLSFAIGVSGWEHGEMLGATVLLAQAAAAATEAAYIAPDHTFVYI